MRCNETVSHCHVSRAWNRVSISGHQLSASWLTFPGGVLCHSQARSPTYPPRPQGEKTTHLLEQRCLIRRGTPVDRDTPQNPCEPPNAPTVRHGSLLVFALPARAAPVLQVQKFAGACFTDHCEIALPKSLPVSAYDEVRGLLQLWDSASEAGELV